MDRVVFDLLFSTVADKVDPLQFAYKKRFSQEDARMTLLNTVARHLDSAFSYTRILLIDFPSAFNTVNIHTLLYRLVELQVNQKLVLWIINYLQSKPPHVVINGFKSSTVFLNTRLPHGFDLSPIFFSIYTNHI